MVVVSFDLTGCCKASEGRNVAQVSVMELQPFEPFVYDLMCCWVPMTYCTALVLVELLQGDLIQGV